MRLSPADRRLLDANPPEWASSRGDVRRTERRRQSRTPNAPKTGMPSATPISSRGVLSGEERWAERADEAYRRGWLLDSAAGRRAIGKVPVAEPMLHMVELAQMRHDTAEVMRLAESLLRGRYHE